jgi:hypothetical protein
LKHYYKQANKSFQRGFRLAGANKSDRFALAPYAPSAAAAHAMTIQGQNKFCDINEAFQKELGLGWYRVLTKKALKH